MLTLLRSPDHIESSCRLKVQTMIETAQNAQNRFPITSATQRDTSQKLLVLRIKTLRGKYRQILTPSEDFARQKQEAIVREPDVT